MLIKGWLYKKKSDNAITLFSSWNKRLFIFDGENLKYYDNIYIMGDPLQIINIKNIKGIEDCFEDLLSFKLFTTNRIYILRAENEKDKNIWMIRLDEGIKNYEDKIQKQFNEEIDKAKQYIVKLKKNV
jgi:hypothetical protein